MFPIIRNSPNGTKVKTRGDTAFAAANFGGIGSGYYVKLEGSFELTPGGLSGKVRKVTLFSPSGDKVYVLSDLNIDIMKYYLASYGYKPDYSGITTVLESITKNGLNYLGNSTSEYLVGTEKADKIGGSGGGDVIYGLGGADILLGNSGNDALYGGYGADKLYGHGGEDALLGGVGEDFLSGGAGDDDLIGGDDNDVLYGGDDNDFLHGELGNDKLYGEDGNDRLIGGIGRDKLYGGSGVDHLSGEAGADLLKGGGGGDILDGGAGSDVMFGGGGADVFEFRVGDGADKIRDFEVGVDQIRFLDGPTEFSDLTIYRSKSTTIIEFGSDQIVLTDVRPFELNHDDFVFG
ncbi:calcium-binding protein [Aliiroseovarius pelagivivens]|nr:calcium-binding protein [Aliiroseovarius pelagivivens]